MPTHAETRILPYRPEQMFELVADVAQYPKFLPWCLAARVRKRDGDVMVADLVIGFKMIRERFTSRVTLRGPDRIDVEYIEGPLRYLNNSWVFHEHPDGCLVDFSVDFEFKSKLLQNMIGALFNQAFQRMVAAFEDRAEALYGEEKPTVGKAAPTPAKSARAGSA